MTFRSDHDAALARVDALEQELAAERKKVAETQQLLDHERAKRKRLQAMVADGGRPAEAPARSWEQISDGVIYRTQQPWDLVGTGLAIALAFALALFVLALAMA